jgi:hypothetical protein
MGSAYFDTGAIPKDTEGRLVTARSNIEKRDTVDDG